MKVDITSMFFNSSIDGQTATPAWRTSLGQNKTKECRIETDVPGVIDIVVGMTYKIVGDISKLNMSGISGNLLMCSVFDKIYVNSEPLPNVSYTLLLLKETSQSHEGRMQLCYSPHIVYDGKSNSDAINQIRDAIGCTPQGCWFVYDISIKNQDELHFSTKVVDPEKPKTYIGKSQQRSKEWKALIDSPILTIDELASILKDLYEEGKKAGEGVANIFFFGLKYADCILTNNYKTKDIIEKSGIGASFQAELDKAIKLYSLLQRKGWSSIKQKSNIVASLTEDTSYLPYLTALRTKPFMLLAGISGTGKSRIVRELAFKSCPECLQDKDGTTPGNYCMIEVKPNWHDSSELLGYYSNIAKGYQFTKFVKFLVKAMMFPKVPFFVCMDEMNLAPVEQYFAEFLSVLETRKKVGDTIQSGVLVDAKYFKDIPNAEMGDGYICTHFFDNELPKIEYNIYTNPTLITYGLKLPANVFIIGTVNMDDTTHQFSRKVIDRAMTIEMNGEDLTKMFDGTNNLEYLPEDQVWELAQFQSKYVSADEVLQLYKDTEGNLTEDGKYLKDQLTQRLTDINYALKDTPFVVSYRVLNELIIYAGVLLDSGKSVQEAIDSAIDRIALMKILPRIEGDEDMLGLATDANNRLCKLMPLVGEESRKKLTEMNNRLKTGFTRFWP